MTSVSWCLVLQVIQNEIYSLFRRQDRYMNDREWQRFVNLAYQFVDLFLRRRVFPAGGVIHQRKKIENKYLLIRYAFHCLSKKLGFWYSEEEIICSCIGNCSIEEYDITRH